MQVNEFFSRYANTPIGERLVILDFLQHGTLNLQELYRRIHDLEEHMRPKRVEQERLIRIAEEYWQRDQDSSKSL